MDKQNLLNAVNLITEFLDSRPSGENQWIDEEGQNHNADIGYVSEFLDDLKLYLERSWEPKTLCTTSFKYMVRWKWRKEEYGEMMCENIIVKQNRLEMINGLSAKSLPFGAFSAIEVTEIISGRHVFGYGHIA